MTAGVSMVIATYNRSQHLRESLGRLESLTLPDEIVVVDDGGCDTTHIVCQSFDDLLPIPVRYHYTHNPGWSNRCHASNVGIRLAGYDEILFTDAEMLFTSDVVAQLLEARQRDDESVLCVEHVVRELDGIETEIVPGGNVGLYKKDWLLEIGGWDEGLPAPTGWDDADLHTRLAWAGHPQRKVPGTTARHLWHPIHPWNKGGQHVENPNLKVFQSKEFPRDLIANVDVEWGVAR